MQRNRHDAATCLGLEKLEDPWKYGKRRYDDVRCRVWAERDDDAMTMANLSPPSSSLLKLELTECAREERERERDGGGGGVHMNVTKLNRTNILRSVHVCLVIRMSRREEDVI